MSRSKPSTLRSPASETQCPVPPVGVAARTLLLLLVPSIGLAQAPAVISIDPPRNQLNVNVAADVIVTFDVDMNASTIDASTFLVAGAQSGPASGAISYDVPSRTVTFDPATDFIEGEVVAVVLSDGIESAIGNALDGHAWSFTAVAAPAPATFPSTHATAVASAPQAVSVVDLDDDEYLDLATANASSGGPVGAPVAVNLNAGDGTFEALEFYFVGSTPHPVVAADLDGDGHADIATGNKDDSTLSVLINVGDGTFLADVTYPLNFWAFSLAVADLDTDGDNDLVVGYYGSDVVSVLLNDGDGTFAPKTDYVAGTPGFGTRGVVTADLDDDGDVDVAATDYGSDQVSLLLNVGDGSFAPRLTHATETGPHTLAAGDLNGDGRLDLVVGHYDTSNLSVLMNDGEGTFATQVPYSVGPLTRGIAVGDVDGDGHLDLATASYRLAAEGANVYVRLNDGDGTFGPPIGRVAGDRPTALVAADTDRDGDLDLAVANQTSDDVVVLVNEGIVAAPWQSPPPAGITYLSISPTPFNPSLTIRFSLAERASLHAEVLSISGRRVRTLESGRSFGPGSHALHWDGRSDEGHPLASGVYHVRLVGAGETRSVRAVLVR